MYRESTFPGGEKVHMVVVLCHLSAESEICPFSVGNGSILMESPGLKPLTGKLLVLLYRAQGKWQHLATNGTGGGLT